MGQESKNKPPQKGKTNNQTKPEQKYTNISFQQAFLYFLIRGAKEIGNNSSHGLLKHIVGQEREERHNY